MKCKHLFISSLVVLLGLLCGSFTINEKNNVSAVSDISHTFTTTGTDYTFCGSNSGVSCSDYKYLYVTTNFGSNTTTSYAALTLRHNGTSNASLRIYFFTSSTLIDISDFDIIYVGGINNTALLPSDWSITFTLSENNPYSVGNPSGSLSITENGTYDVTNYAQVVVEVPDTETIIQGDYHDDLVSIRNCIIVCAGVVLVLYFFYCIYRMIINTTGGRR